MALTNVALYDLLKPKVGEEAARMIAEVVPPTRELATKADVKALEAATSQQFTELRGEMTSRFTELRGEMNTRFAEAESRSRAETTRTIKWIVGVFVPIWGATWGGIVALVLMR